MQFRAEHFKKNQGKTNQKRSGLILLLLPLSVSLAHAESSPHYFANLKNGLSQLIAPKPTRSAHTIDITSLGHYALDTSKVAELPQITRPQSGQPALSPTITAGIPKTMNLVEAVHRAVQRRPEITQSISTLSAQAANIDVARAGYYPQLSGEGISLPVSVDDKWFL